MLDFVIREAYSVIILGIFSTRIFKLSRSIRFDWALWDRRERSNLFFIMGITLPAWIAVLFSHAIGAEVSYWSFQTILARKSISIALATLVMYPVTARAGYVPRTLRGTVLFVAVLVYLALPYVSLIIK